MHYQISQILSFKQSRNRFYWLGWRALLLVTVLTGSTGCELLNKEKLDDPVVEAAPPEPQEVLPSATPLARASQVDAKFAQQALTSLGYKLGLVDGIWGPRSAKAIRQFEEEQELTSADGLLSELNLYMLEKISSIKRDDFQPKTIVNKRKKPTGIAEKLDPNAPLTEGPQLVFTERAYRMLAKPNPYSEQLALLPSGTGIYIISLQEGWYRVESEAKQLGYIKAD